MDGNCRGALNQKLVSGSISIQCIETNYGSRQSKVCVSEEKIVPRIRNNVCLGDSKTYKCARTVPAMQLL